MTSQTDQGSDSLPGKGDPSVPSLYSSLRSFCSVGVAILYTRLDLAILELEEEAIRAMRLIGFFIATLLGVIMTVFFLLCFLVVLSGTHLLLALGIGGGLCLVVTVILAITTKKIIATRPKFLSQTLVELRRDVEGLRPAPQKDEASP